MKIYFESKAGKAIKSFDERKEKDNITNTLTRENRKGNYDGIWYMVVDSNQIPNSSNHGGFRERADQLSFKQKLLSIQSKIMPETQKLTMVTAFSYTEFMKFIESINIDEGMTYISKIQAPDFWTWSSKFVDTSYVTIRA